MALSAIGAAVGRFIRRRRKRRGERVKALAAALGVTASTVSRWEHGQAVPSLQQFFRILERYEVYLGELGDELAEGEGRPRPVRRLPRTKEEAADLLLTLFGPPGDDPPRSDPYAAPRAAIAALLLLAAELVPEAAGAEEPKEGPGAGGSSPPDS